MHFICAYLRLNCTQYSIQVAVKRFRCRLRHQKESMAPYNKKYGLQILYQCPPPGPTVRGVGRSPEPNVTSNAASRILTVAVTLMSKLPHEDPSDSASCSVSEANESMMIHCGDDSYATQLWRIATRTRTNVRQNECNESMRSKTKITMCKEKEKSPTKHQLVQW
jgi:hypothetical protein